MRAHRERGESARGQQAADVRDQEPPRHGGPGQHQLDQLRASGALTPGAVARVLALFPREHDALLAELHALEGNAFVAEVLAQLGDLEPDDGEAASDPRAQGLEDALPAPPSARPRAQGLEDAPQAPPKAQPRAQGLDDAPQAPPRAQGLEDDEVVDYRLAEGWNLANLINVVRFDRATHGKFAKRNGQLDAERVHQWQREHRLTPRIPGAVDSDTCEVAEGRHPQAPPRILRVDAPEEASSDAVPITVEVETRPWHVVSVRIVSFPDGPLMPGRSNGAGLATIKTIARLPLSAAVGWPAEVPFYVVAIDQNGRESAGYLKLVRIKGGARPPGPPGPLRGVDQSASDRVNDHDDSFDRSS